MSWPDPVEVQLGGIRRGQVRVRMRIGDGRTPVVVIERIAHEKGQYSVSSAIEVPPHRCAELGAILVRFAQAVPDFR